MAGQSVVTRAFPEILPLFMEPVIRRYLRMSLYERRRALRFNFHSCNSIVSRSPSVYNIACASTWIKIKKRKKKKKKEKGREKKGKKRKKEREKYKKRLEKALTTRNKKGRKNLRAR